MPKLGRSILNKEDSELYNKIVDAWNLNENLNNVIQFLQHLEDQYPIRNIELKDYIYDGPEDGAKEPIFYGGEGFHIARVYHFVCGHLALYNGNKITKKEHYEKLKAFCWREINKIESVLFKNPLYGRSASVLFEFFNLLVTVALENKDTQTLVRAYNSVLKSVDYLETIGIWNPSLLNKASLSVVFDKLINDTYKDKENPERIFISHKKIFRAYTDAISYSFDNEPCLIIGETGSGKERIAEILHDFSNRRKRNYRAVNCGGFTESLFNAEIQGFVKGSFTGATTSRLGVFLSACGKNEDGINYGYVVDNDKIRFRTSQKKLVDIPNEDELEEVGGTVFLDEINSLDISLQTVLLRIIEKQEVHVVGEDRTRKINVKVVCATNAEPSTLISNRLLREDLYHRIAKGIVYVPSLRELKDSMDEIVASFIMRICKKLDIERKIIIKPKTLKILKQHNWPGNMRELENVLYRAIKKTEANNEDTINPDNIEYLIRSIKDNDSSKGPDFDGVKYYNLRQNYLTYIHTKTEGNQSKAEELTGISRATIARDWEKYGLFQTRKRNPN